MAKNKWSLNRIHKSITKIEEQEIDEKRMFDLTQMIAQLDTKSLTKNDDEQLFDCIFLYIALLYNYSKNSTDYRQCIIIIKHNFKIIDEILSDIDYEAQFLNCTKLIMESIIEDNRDEIFCSKELLHLYNRCLNAVSAEFKSDLMRSYEYNYFALFDFMSNIGDYEMKEVIISIILNLFDTEEHFHVYAKEFVPEKGELYEKFKQLYKISIRSFLNSANKQYRTAFAFECKAVFLGDDELLKTNEMDSIWLDFNLIQNFATFSFKEVHLSNELNAKIDKEQIIFQVNDVADYKLSENENVANIKIVFKHPCFCSYDKLQSILNTRNNITIHFARDANNVNDFLKLVKELFQVKNLELNQSQRTTDPSVKNSTNYESILMSLESDDINIYRKSSDGPSVTTVPTLRKFTTSINSANVAGTSSEESVIREISQMNSSSRSEVDDMYKMVMEKSLESAKKDNRNKSNLKYAHANVSPTETSSTPTLIDDSVENANLEILQTKIDNIDIYHSENNNLEENAVFDNLSVTNNLSQIYLSQQSSQETVKTSVFQPSKTVQNSQINKNNLSVIFEQTESTLTAHMIQNSTQEMQKSKNELDQLRSDKLFVSNQQILEENELENSKENCFEIFQYENEGKSILEISKSLSSHSSNMQIQNFGDKTIKTEPQTPQTTTEEKSTGTIFIQDNPNLESNLIFIIDEVDSEMNTSSEREVVYQKTLPNEILGQNKDIEEQLSVSSGTPELYNFDTATNTPVKSEIIQTPTQDVIVIENDTNQQSRNFLVINPDFIEAQTDTYTGVPTDNQGIYDQQNNNFLEDLPKKSANLEIESDERSNTSQIMEESSESTSIFAFLSRESEKIKRIESSSKYDTQTDFHKMYNTSTSKNSEKRRLYDSSDPIDPFDILKNTSNSTKNSEKCFSKKGMYNGSSSSSNSSLNLIDKELMQKGSIISCNDVTKRHKVKRKSKAISLQKRKLYDTKSIIMRKINLKNEQLLERLNKKSKSKTQMVNNIDEKYDELQNFLHCHRIPVKEINFGTVSNGNDSETSSDSTVGKTIIIPSKLRKKPTRKNKMNERKVNAGPSGIANKRRKAAKITQLDSSTSDSDDLRNVSDESPELVKQELMGNSDNMEVNSPIIRTKRRKILKIPETQDSTISGFSINNKSHSTSKGGSVLNSIGTTARIGKKNVREIAEQSTSKVKILSNVLLKG